MEKTDQGLRFTAINVAIAAEVEGEKDYEKTTTLESKLEKYCPISAALNFPVSLRLEVKATG